MKSPRLVERLNNFLQAILCTVKKNPRVHFDVKRISGLMPPDVDVRALYGDYMLRKHQWSRSPNGEESGAAAETAEVQSRYDLHVCEQIELGEAAISEGRTVSHDEVMQRFSKG